MAISAATKMMIGRTWKAISTPDAPGPSTAVICPHAFVSASGPKTNVAPTPAKPTRRLKPFPSVVNNAAPAVVLRTSSAKTI